MTEHTTPQPIPIMVGFRLGEDPGTQGSVWVLRVIEHGFDDVIVWKWVTPGFQMDQSKGLYDAMIHEMLPLVGRRHGVWIFHIVAHDFARSDWGGRYAPAVPPISERVREIAAQAQLAAPGTLKVEWTPGADGGGEYVVTRPDGSPVVIP